MTGVYYCQHQNSSLTEEFNKLIADVNIEDLNFGEH